MSPPVVQMATGVQNLWVESAARFSPYRRADLVGERTCFTCRHFQGTYYREQLVCERQGRYAVGTPKMGCAFWEREPGSDNE